MQIQQEYRILSFSTSETKMKKIMGNLTLESCENKEIISAKLWEEDLNKFPKNYFKPNNIIFVEDGTYNEQYKNLIIKKMTLIEEAKAGLDEDSREKLYSEFINEINSLNNEKFKNAILEEVNKNEEKLKIAPAAKNNHHNYIGGLLVHTMECVKVAKSLLPVFVKNVDKDTIIAACIMHDFGKIFEYKIDLETGFVEIDEEFIKKWVTHTQYGFAWANTHGFFEIGRMIAAHHGRKDWGAIIDLDEKNIEPELYLLHHVDDISAKFGAIKADDLP